MSATTEVDKVRYSHQTTARILDISNQTLSRYVKYSLITPIRIGRRRFYLPDDVRNLGQAK